MNGLPSSDLHTHVNRFVPGRLKDTNLDKLVIRKLGKPSREDNRVGKEELYCRRADGLAFKHWRDLKCDVDYLSLKSIARG